MGENDDLIAGTDDCAEDEIVVGDAVTPKVISVVADVLHAPKEMMGLETAAADLEGWDSFGHVRIVLAIEKAFDISLSIGAIEKAASVAGLVDAVERALKER